MSLLDLKPNLRPFSPQDYWAVAEGVTPPAFDALGAGATEGAMTSFGLGTVVRDLMTPDPVPQDEGRIMDRDLNAPRKRAALEMRQEQARQAGGGELDEAGWKSSEFAREGLKWEPGMTRARAAALADLYDASRYRQYILSNAKGGAYAAGIAGQFLGAAVDPINYVPVLGPATKAAAVAKFGRIGGSALVAGADAALNTAAAGLLTRDARATYGDDVSWTSFAIDVAMGAAIGGMFGAGVGAWERLRMNRQANTLPRVAEAQGALNEAAGDIVAGRPVQLSDATIAAMRKTADELAPVLRREEVLATLPPEIRANGITPEYMRAERHRAEQEYMMSPDAFLTPDPYTAFAEVAPTITPERADLFMAHGMASGERDGNLIGLLRDGLDPTRVLNEGPIVPGTNGVDTTRTRGVPYILLSDEGKTVAETGIKNVVLVGPSERLKPALEAQFPDRNFMTVDEAARFIETGEAPPRTVAAAADAGVSRAIDSSPAPAPEPDPRAIEAAASVGRPVSGEQALADDLGIDIETGNSVAMLELEQLRQAGRLTAEDEAMLAEIEADAARAEAIGEGLKAAAICRMT